jgi:hypothetical protein
MLEEHHIEEAKKFLDWWVNDTYCFWPTVGMLFGYGLVSILFMIFDMFNFQNLRLQSHKKIPAYEFGPIGLVAFNGFVIVPVTNWLFLDCACSYYGVTATWDIPTLKQCKFCFFWR